MSGLNASMSMAVAALMAEQGALNATSNNIANVNTPGYTRQVPVLTEAPTFPEGNLVFGSGVTLQQFQSVRDQLLQLRVYEETQQQGSSDAQVSSLQQVESVFSDSSSGIGGSISALFNALSQLSTDPSNMSARQQVLTAAASLASSFHQSVSSLQNIQTGLNQIVPQTVIQINQLTQQIAKLNGQAAQMQAVGQEPGSIQDQRDELIRQLSSLTDLAVTQSEHGITLTTANGVPLVVGNQSFSLQSGTGANGLQGVFAQGQEITSSLQSGKLGGVIAVRDQVIPGLLNQLDTLASQFTTSFNAAHAAGFDLSGNPGQNFFVPVSGTGAASNFAVSITDPHLVAASSDGAPGSSGNIANLIAVRDQQLPAGASPLDTYANLVLEVGNFSASAKANSTATGLTLRQLNDQLSATSGVSLDEESTNMIRYQRAYQAAARVVTTVDQMMQTILTMAT